MSKETPILSRKHCCRIRKVEPLRRYFADLDAYVSSTQTHVTGTVRLRLFKGTCTVVGRKSDVSLYRHDLATYDVGDAFDHQASVGFIELFGLPTRTQAQVQGEAD